MAKSSSQKKVERKTIALALLSGALLTLLTLASWRYLYTGPPIFGHKEDAIGIVYYLQDDSTGRDVHLLTAGQLVRISFDNVELQGFGNRDAYKNGAEWIFRWHATNDKILLDRAVYKGSYDDRIRQADALIRRHYTLLGKGDFKGAYRDLSPEWRRGQTYNQFVKGYENSPLTEFSDSAPARAIKIMRPSKDQPTDQIKALVDLRWFSVGGHGFFQFTLTKRDGVWSIERVKESSQSIWNAY